MKDIVATLRVETRRVAVRSTVWLGHQRARLIMNRGAVALDDTRGDALD